MLVVVGASSKTITHTCVLGFSQGFSGHALSRQSRAFPDTLLRIKLLVSCTDQWTYRDGAGTLVFSLEPAMLTRAAQRCTRNVQK